MHTLIHLFKNLVILKLEDIHPLYPEKIYVFFQ